jgi:hypothetical protein
MNQKIAKSCSATVLWLLPLLAAGCAANSQPEDGDVGLEAEALSAQHAPSVPAALAVPDGNRLLFHAAAEGVQIYACQASGSAAPAWVFTEPEAELFDRHDRLVATHYKGPTWQARDGSTVVGTKLAAAQPDPNSIPWLLLQASAHTGTGLMSGVTFIQRLNTHEGNAPTSGCDADQIGAIARVDYTATYSREFCHRGNVAVSPVMNC